MPGQGPFRLLATPADIECRLDRFVSERLAEVSRSLAAQLIRAGNVRVDERCRKPGYRMQPGDTVTGSIPPPEPADCRAEPLPLAFLYQDEHIAVVDKPAGMVVHPAPGHAGGTLVNALLFHCGGLTGIGGQLRPGIVHRLDKDTSGVMVVAKRQGALNRLAEQFKQRRVQKVYLALVAGVPAADRGRIDLPLGRHPVHRKKMAVRPANGRPAETGWRVRKRMEPAALLEARPRTGRTHQIRVHFAAMGHPIVGDAVYGRRGAAPGADRSELARLAGRAARQMLHAWRLAFDHPHGGRRMQFECPLPADMRAVLHALRQPAG